MTDGEAAKTTIADDVEVTGTIKCASNIEINGKLNGDLNCAGRAVIGDTAHVKGNINVEVVTVFGQINGNVVAKDRIELKSTARMLGDIKAKRLTVEDGVTFVGKSDVNPGATAAGTPAGGARGRTTPQPTTPQPVGGGATAEEEPSEGEPDKKPKGGAFGKK